MGNTPVLKSIAYSASDDLEWVGIRLIHQDGSEHRVALPEVAMHGVIGDLIKFTTLLQAQKALTPDPDAAPEPTETLPPTESALLLAKTADVVRWDAGGALLRIQTTEGLSMHIALTPDLVKFVVQSLGEALPS